MNILKIIFYEIFTLFMFFLEGVPGKSGKLLRQFIYGFLIKTDKNLNIENGVSIYGYSNITLGKNVSLMKQTKIYVRNANLVIGNNFACNNNCFLGCDFGDVTIGNNVLFGPNVVLRSSDHKHDLIDLPINQQGHIKGKIKIEDGVWVASNAVITKNVTVGFNSIVAAGSVVTKDVEPNTIVAGVPAKKIANR